MKAKCHEAREQKEETQYAQWLTDALLDANASLYRIAEEGKLDQWVPACGGREIPVAFEGQHYLYVFNFKRQLHGYLHVETDIVAPFAPWQATVETLER